MNATVPTFYQWDDHEVVNNWSPGKDLGADDRYTEKSVHVLAARAGRAFHEMTPIRFTPAEPGRVYRKVGYGPLLDVFFVDLRSYRGREHRRHGAAADRREPHLRRRPGRLAEARARRVDRHLEGHRLRHADRPPRARHGRRRPPDRGDRQRRSPALRSAASSSSPRSCASSRRPASPTPSGSPPTSTTPPRITTTRRAPRSRTSTRSGSSSPARCTPAPSARTRSTRPSAPRSAS